MSARVREHGSPPRSRRRDEKYENVADPPTTYRTFTERPRVASRRHQEEDEEDDIAVAEVDEEESSRRRRPPPGRISSAVNVSRSREDFPPRDLRNRIIGTSQFWDRRGAIEEPEDEEEQPTSIPRRGLSSVIASVAPPLAGSFRSEKRYDALAPAQDGRGVKRKLTSAIVADPSVISEKPAPHLNLKPEDRKRNKRLFGTAILGTLKVFKKDWAKFEQSDAAKKQEEAQRKIQEREAEERRKQVEEHRRIMREKREKQRAEAEAARRAAEEKESKRLQEIWDKHEAQLSRFILSSAVPPIYWTPLKHTSVTAGLINIIERTVELENEEMGEAGIQPGEDENMLGQDVNAGDQEGEDVVVEEDETLDDADADVDQTEANGSSLQPAKNGSINKAAPDRYNPDSDPGNAEHSSRKRATSQDNSGMSGDESG